LARLGREPSRAWAARPSVADRGAIVGRGSHVSALDEALRAVKRDEAVVACVHGSSGSGKSTLTQWFTRNRLPANTVLLQSRCYPRESVPYNALDGIVEQLSVHLHSLAAKDLWQYLPQHLSALVQVFPVLNWLADTRASGAPEAGGPDPIQVRRDAFDALRDVLRRLAANRPLVLVVDDLQWGDAESALALEELLRQPEQPGALVIASFRTEDIASEPFLQSLIDRARRRDTGLQVREIELGPLADHDSRELATRLVVDAPGARAAIDDIVRESGGVPFLIELLSRYVSTAPATVAGRAVTVDEMIAAALGDLPDGCRGFMEAVTVAARPIDLAVAREAAGVVEDERRLVGVLQRAYLLRPAGSAASIEPYHDHIRTTLFRQIPSSRLKAIHLRLATAMESHGIQEPETLSEHYFEGGDRALAATHAGRAAMAAGRQLAFERAATLYRRALELRPEAPERPQWQVGLADALANAGRGVDAAHAYLAAGSDTGVDAAAMHRAAADQLLRCGHIREGLAVVGTLAAEAGLGTHRMRMATIARVMVRRAALSVKDWRFTERPAHTIDPALLMRIDLGLTLAAGLARVDGVRAAGYQSLAATLALAAGEPVRVARAMLGEAAFRCLRGAPTFRETQDLLSRATALADRLQQPYLNGLVHLVRCMAFAHIGQFAAAFPNAERGEHIFRHQCVGVWRDIDLAQAYTMLSLYYLGDLVELGRRVPRRLQEAKDHDDHYAVADALGVPNILWLVRDDVGGARGALADIRQPKGADQLDWPDWLRLFSETQADLYAGQPLRALERIEAGLRGFAGATIMWVQSTRIEAAHLHARCALAAASQATNGRAVLATARRSARRLRHERVAWADAFADLVAAGAADHSEHPAAVDLTARALERLESCGFMLYAAAARRRFGALVGGTTGQQAIAAADSWMNAQGVVSPVRMTSMLAPGFRD
jgi:hypothetical protein